MTGIMQIRKEIAKTNRMSSLGRGKRFLRKNKISSLKLSELKISLYNVINQSDTEFQSTN
jgi:hypothetical protein